MAAKRRTWLSASEAASALRCSERTIRRMRDTGKLEMKRINARKFLYSQEGIDRFLEKCQGITLRQTALV